jgi:hypothetical protein
MCAVCSLACSRADSASLVQVGSAAIPEDEEDTPTFLPSTKALECGPKKPPTVTQSFKVRRIHSQVVQLYLCACGHAHKPDFSNAGDEGLTNQMTHRDRCTRLDTTSRQWRWTHLGKIMHVCQACFACRVLDALLFVCTTRVVCSPLCGKQREITS